MKTKQKIIMGIITILLVSCAADNGDAPVTKTAKGELNGPISWQIQYTGELDPYVDVQLINIDLFGTTSDQILDF